MHNLYWPTIIVLFLVHHRIAVVAIPDYNAPPNNIINNSGPYAQPLVHNVPDFSPTGSRLTVGTPSANADIEPHQLDAIANTPNFRLIGKRGKDERPWFSGREMRHIHCVRPARCERLRNATCFGSRLAYAQTSLDLTDAFDQAETRRLLQTYEALRHIPKCWAVVQPFLCAVFVPRCERIGDQGDMVFLPSLEMCRITMEPCRLLYNSTFFPEYLRCNETLFPSKCNNDVREVKFNTTGECAAPLVATDQPTSYYEDIEGCGVQCNDPLYTLDEHRQVHQLNMYGATLCLACNLLTVLTFLIDWSNANKYPAVIIFYINLCFMVNCLAWLAQGWPGNREDIVCRKDGTLRHAEPSAGENLSCIAVFLSVYYSLVAAMVWFVIFTYSWHLQALGSVHRIDKKSSYFHLMAWSLPLVLTIATMALSEVDGNSIAGICFVGYVNHVWRAWFLFGPLGMVLAMGTFFITRGMVTLVQLRGYTREKSMSASKKIHGIIKRMGITAVAVFVCILVVVAFQVIEFRSKPLWAESLRKFIICKIATSHDDQPHNVCKLDHRPSLAVLQLQLLCLFIAGIVMSSWCWTRHSLEAWRRYWRRKFGIPPADDEDGNGGGGGGNGAGGKQKQKYKIIAETYAKRKEFQKTGRLSVSFNRPHTDPAGLNFDINDLHSLATNEMSSTFCNYLPKITRRRSAHALIDPNGLNVVEINEQQHGATTRRVAATRKSSVDSEISFSVRQYSMESRRNSMDSQVSVQIAEVQTKVACRSTHSSAGHLHHGQHHHRGHAKGVKAGRHSSSKRFQQHATTMRRGSSTSMESHIIVGGAHGSRASGRDKRMRRRSANAGLAANVNDINMLIERFPDLTRNFQGMTTTSDEDVSQAGGVVGADDGSAMMRIENTSGLDAMVRQIAHKQIQQQQQQQQLVPMQQESFQMRLQNNNDDDDDDEENVEEESVLLGIQQQHFRRNVAIQQKTNNGNTMPSTADISIALLSSGGGCGSAAGRASTMPVGSDFAIREGRTSKNSQRSSVGGGRAASLTRKSVRRSSSQHKKQRKSAKLAKAAASAANNNQPQQQLALVEPHRLHNMLSGGGCTTNTSTTSSATTSTGSSTSSSFTSYSSEFALPNAGLINGVQSSFSGMSVGKHSRSSKTSCDVGTQANASEIATQTASGTENNNGALMQNTIKSTTSKNRSSSRKSKSNHQHGRRNGQNDINGHGSDVTTTAVDNYTATDEIADDARNMMTAAMSTQTQLQGVSPPTPSSATSMMLMMGGNSIRRTGASTMMGSRRVGAGVGVDDMMSETEKLRMLLLPST